MKLKRLPQDFQVEELTDFPANGGQFALYKLEKESLGTPEAIEAILRQWNLPRADIGYGGLKDRHARTIQYVTIRGGPRRGLRQQHLTLTHLGQCPRPFGPRDIAANRFQIVLRDLTDEGLQRMLPLLDEVGRDGVPNYFDEQRFGSLGESGEFMARPWCEGNFERALWLALADPNPHDRPDDREEKEILRQHWGDWSRCKAELPRSDRLSIITFLDDRPGDFRGALARIRIDLRSIYLAAYQSDLWNSLLAALLRQHCRPEQLFTLPIAREQVPFYQSLDEPQRQILLSAELPLPSARTHLDDGPVKELVDRVLAEKGLELRQIRVKYPRDSFFSKGLRRAVLLARNLRHEAAPDDLHPGRQKVTLRFELGRGSYATMLVKRITANEAEGTESEG